MKDRIHGYGFHTLLYIQLYVRSQESRTIIIQSSYKMTTVSRYFPREPDRYTATFHIVKLLKILLLKTTNLFEYSFKMTELGS